MDCSPSGAGRGPLLGDRSLGDLAPGEHWALFPSFMDGETEAQGKEVITPGSQDRLESVSQLCSPVQPPPVGPLGLPSSIHLPPPSSCGLLGLRDLRIRWVLFLSRKPHGHALRACSCDSSCWGPFAPHARPERGRRSCGQKEQRHRGHSTSPSTCLPSSLGAACGAEECGGPTPTASDVGPHPDPPLSGPPGLLLTPQGQQRTVMPGGSGEADAFPPAPLLPDLLPVWFPTGDLRAASQPAWRKEGFPTQPLLLPQPWPRGSCISMHIWKQPLLLC